MPRSWTLTSAMAGLCPCMSVNSAFRARASVLLAFGLGLLLRTATASANEYLPTGAGESWTYVSDHGELVESQITPGSGGWTRFSRFLNRRDQWVWTSPTNDRIYLWVGSGARPLVDLSSLGSGSVAIDLGCTPALLLIDARGTTLAVPAGTFADVIRLRVTAPCVDVGVTDISFAKGVGIIQWSENTFFGNVTFKMVRGPSVERLVRIPAAARDTYDAISRNLSAEVRTAIDGLPQTVLLDHATFAMMAPPELSIALPDAIRDTLAQQGLDPLSDAEVDRLALVVAVDLVDLVDLITEQESATELAMIHLQSAMAARAETLELIDNMLEAIASSTNTIIGQIN